MAKLKSKAKATVSGLIDLDPKALHFLADVATEVGKARAKFPPPDNTLLAAFVEEVGEVAKALMDLENGDISFAEYYTECKQAAAMATRLAVEGDPGFPVSQKLARK